MDQFLTAEDVRVLGALIEKEATTPDTYPLTLNALRSACNQSSNRDPVVSFDDETILAAITRLRRESLVRGIQRSDSRVTKYHHLMGDTLNLTTGEVAVMCVLMLRGPQTIGEIRTRTERLAHFEHLSDVEAILTVLIERGEPLAVRLPRQPGQKEVRYAHLLSGAVTYDTPDGAPSTPASSPTSDRLSALEDLTSELKNDVADLRRQLEEFRKQFE